jgi:hypothetical protein
MKLFDKRTTNDVGLIQKKNPSGCLNDWLGFLLCLFESTSHSHSTELITWNEFLKMFNSNFL